MPSSGPSSRTSKVSVRFVVFPAASFAEVDGTFTNNAGNVQRVADVADPLLQAEAAQQQGLPIVLIPAAYNRNGWDGGDRPPELVPVLRLSM